MMIKGVHPLAKRVLSYGGIIFILTASLYVFANTWSSPEFKAVRLHGQRKIALPPIKDELAKRAITDEDFGELGKRVQILTKYTGTADDVAHSYHRKSEASILLEVEALTLSMFPWLRKNGSVDPMPFRSLRKTVVPKSRGIVIPVGLKHFRFASHLIATLRDVLHSKLPIVVVHAGDEDLPLEFRNAFVSMGSDISILDINHIFDEDIIRVNGSWAIKPFAMLASKFAETILLDADTVLLQDPSIVFSYPAYQETGAYFFHDRLLWKHAYQDRHHWWEKQIGLSLDKTSNDTKPAQTKSISKSKVYMEDFAEEQDSGIVVMDKSRLPITMSLLHICWQNTPSVRKNITYQMTYGDKESWWFGMELSGVEYSFEPGYGSIAGEKRDDRMVCSFTIAHPDATNTSKLLWYNGSLLKNKMVNSTEFSVPEYWMTNATWFKGASKREMSCMGDGAVRRIDEEQVDVVRRSVEVARKIDEAFKDLVAI